MASLLAEPLRLEDLILTPYTSPVSPKQFGRLSGNLLFVAFVILSWFIMYAPSIISPFRSYLVNKPKEQRSLAKEIVAAVFASVFAGFGTIFLIMWTGIFL